MWGLRVARRLGLGIGWRPELAVWIERRSDLGFVEVIAENLGPDVEVPVALQRLVDRGITVVPHGISLSLGGAQPPDPRRLAMLERVAARTGAPLVSEHLAFVRADQLETGHLLPVPRTREALGIVVENLRQAKAALPVPLAIENISALLEWPQAEMDETTFLTEVLEQADVGLVLDVSNVYANAYNHGFDARQFFDQIPLDRIAYVHVGGGTVRDNRYHDTHAHPVPEGVYELLEELAARTELPGVMLERDDNFPTEQELHDELDRIADAAARGRTRREESHAG